LPFDAFAKVFFYLLREVLTLGVAFPCCLSVNNCICHFSPLTSDPDVVLKEGDVVKVSRNRIISKWFRNISPMHVIHSQIDMGAHIDGFIAVVAHTVVVGMSEVTGRKADAILAAYYASEAALRLTRPGGEVSKSFNT